MFFILFQVFCKDNKDAAGSEISGLAAIFKTARTLCSLTYDNTKWTHKMNDKEDVLSKEPPSKDFSIRCPRLGHQINFAYCQIENRGIPCFKTLDCWYNYFDVHSFLENRLSKEDFKKAFVTKGQPKVLSLLDLIEKAKAKKGKKN